MFIRVIAVCAAALGLAALPGCGFKPIYAQSTGVNADFGAIQVHTGDGRSAYLVRQALLNTMGAERPGVPPRYDLRLEVQERRLGLGLRVNEVATRYEIRLTARYAVHDLENDNAVMTRGASVAAASFDVTDDVYADIAVEENAKQRAADLLASKLQRELALYFAEI